MRLLSVHGELPVESSLRLNFDPFCRDVPPVWLLLLFHLCFIASGRHYLNMLLYEERSWKASHCFLEGGALLLQRN
jgi:hypothetical protein